MFSRRWPRRNVNRTGYSVMDLTRDPKPADSPVQSHLAGLPDHPELLRVRVTQAQFARALDVSKQSVTRWVRDGWVTPGADGRLDPVVAIGQLLRRCDPGRLRARWLRQAVGEVQQLREIAAAAETRAASLDAELTAARARVARLECLLDGFYENLLTLAPADGADAWRAQVDAQFDAAARHCDDPDGLGELLAELEDFCADHVAAPPRAGDLAGGGGEA